MSAITGVVAASPVQAALYAVLNVASLTALATGGLYSDVPQGSTFPLAWLTFGDPAEEQAGTFGKFGAIVHVDLHVYSRYEGDDECLDILSKAYELVNHAALTVTGFTAPRVEMGSVTIAVEELNDKAIRHGIGRFEVQVLAS